MAFSGGDKIYSSEWDGGDMVFRPVYTVHRVGRLPDILASRNHYFDGSLSFFQSPDKMLNLVAPNL